MIKNYLTYITEEVGNRVFDVGDRVKWISKAYPGAGFPKNSEQLGTVIRLNGEQISVEFDDFIGGHNCYSGKQGHCWNCLPGSLIKVEERPVSIKWYNKGSFKEENNINI
jgi:hypothetical protein